MIKSYNELTKELTDRAATVDNKLGGSAVYTQVDQILTTGGSVEVPFPNR